MNTSVTAAVAIAIGASIEFRLVLALSRVVLRMDAASKK